MIAPPDGCDPAADPKDAPKCVVNEYGIFVDPTAGSDGNSGSKTLPLKTVGAALTKLAGRRCVARCAGGLPGQGGTGGAGGVGACSGGDGGKGGKGGAGSGGAGGISVGVLHKGTQPTIDPTTDAAITIGAAGSKGTGGASGVNDGPDGIAQKILGI